MKMKIVVKLLFAAAIISIFAVANSTAQTRISLARGKTSTVVSGTLGGRGRAAAIKKFVVAARAGQHLSVVVRAVNRSIFTNASGEEGERGADFYYTINEDGDTEFVVENVGSRATKFTMTISIQ